MLDGFHSGGLPGVKPRSYESSDTATFYDILRVAVELSSTCVNGKGQAQAGWSYAGKFFINRHRFLPLFDLGFGAHRMISDFRSTKQERKPASEYSSSDEART